jgi:hypothetical protein
LKDVLQNEIPSWVMFLIHVEPDDENVAIDQLFSLYQATFFSTSIQLSQKMTDS